MALIRTIGGSSKASVRMFYVMSGDTITLDSGKYALYADTSYNPTYESGYWGTVDIGSAAANNRVGVSGSGVTITSAGVRVNSTGEINIDQSIGEIIVANDNTAITITCPTQGTATNYGNSIVIIAIKK